MHHSAHAQIQTTGIRQPQRISPHRRQIYRASCAVDALMPTRQPRAAKDIQAVRPAARLNKQRRNCPSIRRNPNPAPFAAQRRLPKRTRHYLVRIVQRRQPFVIQHIERIELRIRPWCSAALSVVDRLGPRPARTKLKPSTQPPPRLRHHRGTVLRPHTVAGS